MLTTLRLQGKIYISWNMYISPLAPPVFQSIYVRQVLCLWMAWNLTSPAPLSLLICRFQCFPINAYICCFYPLCPPSPPFDSFVRALFSPPHTYLFGPFYLMQSSVANPHTSFRGEITHVPWSFSHHIFRYSIRCNLVYCSVSGFASSSVFDRFELKGFLEAHVCDQAMCDISIVF